MATITHPSICFRHLTLSPAFTLSIRHFLKTALSLSLSLSQASSFSSSNVIETENFDSRFLSYTRPRKSIVSPSILVTDCHRIGTRSRSNACICSNFSNRDKQKTVSRWSGKKKKKKRRKKESSTRSADTSFSYVTSIGFS